VAEIADAAEASKGTLFANFPSKEEIVFADTAPLRERLCHELRHRSSGLSAVDTLRAFVADHMIAPGPRALSAIAIAKAQARSRHGAAASRNQAVAVLDQAAAFLEGGLAAIGATPARRRTA
jgi:AcrR family transcriptional regulator